MKLKLIFRFLETQIFEWMKNTGTIPTLFNISILKPLIKDETKGNNNINNLRPLSISDIYTNVFEKLILYEVKKDHVDHPNQNNLGSKLILRAIMQTLYYLNL